MSYSVTVSLVLGSSQTGLTLKAQVVDTSGTNVGSAVLTGFVEIGLGNYIWTGTISNGQQGAVKFSTTGDVLKAITSLNVIDEEITDHVAGSVNDSAASTSGFIGNSSLSSIDSFYKGMIIVFGAGSSLAGITGEITNYVGSTKVFDVKFPIAPTNGDQFIIIGRIA